jgi:protocatechuate 3,4-dioxygenase beta subunit
MPQVPDPIPTEAGLAYEGRLLPRPAEEVVDQGLSFDVGTLLTRRGVLSLLGLGLGAGALAACNPGRPESSTTGSVGTTSGSTGEIPDETAGPYPGDGSNGPDILERTGVVRQDIRSSLDGGVTAEGIPMTLTLNIFDLASGDVPFKHAAVYVWHCDRAGAYSLYSQGVKDVTYLRGVQAAGADGAVTFSSIFPACYSGRWPHIHFEVYPDVGSITDAAKAISTSQVALPQGVCETVYATTGYEQSVSNLASLSLTTDNVFGDDGGVHQLGTVTGDLSGGYQVALDVHVDTGTIPTGGQPGGPRRGEPGGQGGPGGKPRPTQP